jgi:hypothetical protein
MKVSHLEILRNQPCQTGVEICRIFPTFKYMSPDAPL